MNTAQHGVMLRFALRKPNANNIDQRTQAGILNEILWIGPAIGGEHTHPIISLAFITADEKIANFCQAVGNFDDLSVQVFLGFQGFIKIIMQVFESQRVIEIYYQSRVCRFKKRKFLNHIAGNQYHVAVFNEHLQAADKEDSADEEG